MIDVLKEAIVGSLESIYVIAIIVLPLMVILQIAKDYKVLNKVSGFLNFSPGSLVCRKILPCPCWWELPLE